MGKRSEFKRINKDAYFTWDKRAGLPLLDYYSNKRVTYYEPCVGQGYLIKNLNEFKCVGSSDDELDARITQYNTDAEFFITNPPWSRNLLHPIIENLRKQKPTWLLFDADWMHTQKAIPFIKYCKTIISVGRLKWIFDSPYDGKDNCAWYLFINEETPSTFIPRKTRKPLFS